MSPFVGQLPPAEFSMPDKQAGLAELSRFVEAGRLTPVTDRTYPLSEVPAAILYLAEGSARGKVVIAI